MVENSKNQPLVPSNPMADSNMARSGWMAPAVVAGTEGEPPGLSAAPTVNSLMQALRRRWLLASSLAVGGATLAVLAIFFFFPAGYNAQSRIQVAFRSEQRILIPSPNEDSDFLVYKASLAALIKSPVVVNAALNEVKDLGLVRAQPKPVEWLETALKTDYTLAPEILRLSLNCDNPEEAAKIVNAVTRAFLKEMEQKERTRRLIRLDEMESNYRKLLKELGQKRQALQKSEWDFHLEDPITRQTKYQSALTEWNYAKQALQAKRLEQISAEEDIKGYQDQLGKADTAPISPLHLEDVLRLHPVAQNLYLELAKIDQSISQIKAVGRPNEELLETWNAKKKALQKQIEDQAESLRPELEKKVRQDYRAKLSQKIAELESKIISVKKQEEFLTREVKTRENEANRLNPSLNPLPLTVVALRDEITRLETSLTRLKETITAFNVEPIQSSRVTLLQWAEVPTARDMSKHSRIAGVAGLGMFGLLLFGVSWWEFRARRISAAEEVVQGLKMNLVGTLPALPPQKRSFVPEAGASDLQWQNQLHESVDAIRTLLLHASRTESLQVVMVTSALGGEGKTSLSSQLAASLARAWRKTLLIDGDLRKPAAHALFGLPPDPGLSEILRGEINAADAIRPTPLSRLWFMPAGQWDNHTVQALAQEGVGALFTKLKEEFDFIIVDSSPVLPVADSLLLGQHMDGVIFSILRDVSRTPTVYAAQQRLANVGVHILGAVVIGDRNMAGSITYQYGAKTA